MGSCQNLSGTFPRNSLLGHVIHRLSFGSHAVDECLSRDQVGQEGPVAGDATTDLRVGRDPLDGDRIGAGEVSDQTHFDHLTNILDLVLADDAIRDTHMVLLDQITSLLVDPVTNTGSKPPHDVVVVHRDQDGDIVAIHDISGTVGPDADDVVVPLTTQEALNGLTVTDRYRGLASTHHRTSDQRKNRNFTEPLLHTGQLILVVALAVLSGSSQLASDERPEIHGDTRLIVHRLAVHHLRDVGALQVLHASCTQLGVVLAVPRDTRPVEIESPVFLVVLGQIILLVARPQFVVSIHHRTQDTSEGVLTRLHLLQDVQRKDRGLLILIHDEDLFLLEMTVLALHHTVQTAERTQDRLELPIQVDGASILGPDGELLLVAEVDDVLLRLDQRTYDTHEGGREFFVHSSVHLFHSHGAQLVEDGILDTPRIMPAHGDVMELTGQPVTDPGLRCRTHVEAVLSVEPDVIVGQLLDSHLRMRARVDQRRIEDTITGLEIFHDDTGQNDPVTVHIAVHAFDAVLADPAHETQLEVLRVLPIEIGELGQDLVTLILVQEAEPVALLGEHILHLEARSHTTVRQDRVAEAMKIVAHLHAQTLCHVFGQHDLFVLEMRTDLDKGIRTGNRQATDDTTQTATVYLDDLTLTKRPGVAHHGLRYDTMTNAVLEATVATRV